MDHAAALDAHRRRIAPIHLRTLLADPGRTARLSLEAGPLHADLSRQKLDDAVLAELAAWAQACGFEARRDALFAGAMAKGKVDAATAQVDSATKLKSELTGLGQGHAAPVGGILAGLSGGTGPSLADRFKGLPLAGTVQTVLGNQELIKSLVAGLPLDKVPGYTTAAQALSAFAPK